MSSATVLECKKVCMLRCLSAVALSIGMQFFLLIVFLLFVNFHILHPVFWITNTFSLMFSFLTWLSTIPLISAITVYGFVIGKAHIAVKRYYSSRYKWLLGNALRKLAFLTVHVVVGFMTAWLYTRFLHEDYSSFFLECFGSQCINSRYTFLVYNGVAAGCIFFVKEHMRHEPEVEFPIIQQKKIVHLRSLLYTTLYESLTKSFRPTFGYAFAFWLVGGRVNRHLSSILGSEVDDSFVSLFSIVADIRLIFYSWILTSQILSNMYLMQRFLSIMLAAELNFIIEKKPLNSESTAGITLVEALGMTEVPLMRKLAAWHLYSISQQRKPNKRLEIFALSVPGGHPYNWNQLYSQCLSIINDFTEELQSSLKNIAAMKSPPIFANIKPSARDAAEKILLRQYNESFCIRHLVSENVSTVESTAERPNKFSKFSNAYKRINIALVHFLRQLEESSKVAFRTIPGLFYTFGEPDGAKTAFLLSNSSDIVWLCSGLAGMCAASITEDKYGVVQSALPEVIKALLKLKMELEKLNNVNLNGTKLDRNFITLKSAVKRSLYRICTVFGEYMCELINDAEDLCHLQSFLNYKEA